MENFLKKKETSDILLHELVKCSRLILSSCHRSRGFERHQMEHCNRAHKPFGRHFEEHRRCDVQKIGQGRLLTFLLEKDGISQKELAEVLRIAPASVSELINKLENGGYIEKRQNDSDKRVTNIFLTEGGRFFAQKMEEGRAQMAKDIFAVLTEEEQKQLLFLTQKLIDSFSNKENEVEPQTRDFDQENLDID